MKYIHFKVVTCHFFGIQPSTGHCIGTRKTSVKRSRLVAFLPAGSSMHIKICGNLFPALIRTVSDCSTGKSVSLPRQRPLFANGEDETSSHNELHYAVISVFRLLLI